MNRLKYNPLTGRIDLIEHTTEWTNTLAETIMEVDESSATTTTYKVIVDNGKLYPTDTANTDVIVIGEDVISGFGVPTGSITIGNRTNGSLGSITIGHDTSATSNYGIIIGNGASNDGNGGTVIGRNAAITNTLGTLAIGESCTANGIITSAVGYFNSSSAPYNFALGASCTLGGNASTAIGAFHNDNNHANCFLMGVNASATEFGSVMFMGGKSIELSNTSVPTTNPATGNKFYFDTDGLMYSRDNTGTIRTVSAHDHINTTTGNPHNVLHSELSDAGSNDHAAIDAHIASTANPHSVTLEQARTAGQVMTGQFEVDATSDVVKQILRANATQSANLFETYNASGGLTAQINAAGDFTNPEALQAGSEKFGAGATVTGSSGMAIGNAASAGQDSVALGPGATASGTNSLAIGPGASFTTNGSIMIGNSTTVVSGTQSIAIGELATASGGSGVAIGRLSYAGINLGCAVGYDSDSSGTISLAIGAQSQASGLFSCGVGAGATASNSQATAVGSFTYARAQYSTAIGNGATITNATDTASIVIGSGATSTGPAQLVIGGSAQSLSEGYFNNVANATTKDFRLNASGASGTDNAGSTLTFAGGKGTGTGAGGDLVFQTATPGTTGTAQNLLSEALRIDDTQRSIFTGEHETNNAIYERVDTVTASRAALDTDHIIELDASAGDITYTLPALTVRGGRRLEFIRIDSTANICTIDGNGADLVIGEADQVLNPWDSLILREGSTSWI